MNNELNSQYSAQYHQLTEDIVFFLRQSCYVQVARIDAYLDGVTLAAEQVQDMRIKFLETPPEVTGWEYFGNVLLTAALESTLAGTLLAAATKKIFTPILKQNAVFMALPKSAYGKELNAQAKLLSKIQAGPHIVSYQGIPIRIGKPQPPNITISRALQGGIAGPGLKNLGQNDVQLYHASLEALIRGTDKVQTNLAAAAKAIREAIQRATPAPAPDLGASDSAGVTVLSAAMHYGSLTRLGIQVRHARFEQLVRTGILPPQDLASIADTSDWEDMDMIFTEIRGRYKLLFEAVIWARLYNFDEAKNSPSVQANNKDGVFKGIPLTYSNYWCERFAQAIDEWNQAQKSPKFKGSFKDIPEKQNQLLALRRYFSAISKERV